MNQLIPYITFNGDAEEALNYYKSIFGGEIVEFSRFEEAPPMDGVEFTDDQKKLVMHATYKVNDSIVIMASDSHPAFGGCEVGNNITLSVGTSSKEETEKYFDGVSEGGKITMPLEETFWNSYFGMGTDKFGVNWMFSFDLK